MQKLNINLILIIVFIYNIIKLHSLHDFTLFYYSFFKTSISKFSIVYKAKNIIKNNKYYKKMLS